MKFKKKKKKEQRKIRKQLRKKPPQPFYQWLTRSKNKKIWKLAEAMTRLPSKYPRAIHNHKFHCNKCNRTYCITLNGSGVVYCDKCYWGKCDKEIRDIRDCECE